MFFQDKRFRELGELYKLYDVGTLDRTQRKAKNENRVIRSDPNFEVELVKYIETAPKAHRKMIRDRNEKKTYVVNSNNELNKPPNYEIIVAEPVGRSAVC